MHTVHSRRQNSLELPNEKWISYTMLNATDCWPPEPGSAQGFFQCLPPASSGLTSWFIFLCAKSIKAPFHSLDKS